MANEPSDTAKRAAMCLATQMRPWTTRLDAAKEIPDMLMGPAAVAVIDDAIAELRAENERLRGLLLDVIEGNWSITGLQESLGIV